MKRLLALTLLVSACGTGNASAPASAPVWRTSAVQAMNMLRTAPARDETCRSVVRLSTGGTALRVTLSNLLGEAPLVLSAVTVGLRTTGSAVRPDSLRPVTVRGSRTITVPAGATVDSDPVLLQTGPLTDVAVSVAVAGPVRLTAHRFGADTGWCSGPGTGDRTEDAAGKAFRKGERESVVVEEVAVTAVPTAPRGVLAVGDSLTDAPLPPDTHPRWTDVLATRLPGVPVPSAAIAGNRVVLEGGYGRPLVERFDRDVLSRDGVGTIVLLAGTNDLSRDLTAARLTAALGSLVGKARAQGLRVVLLTIPPATERDAQAAVERRATNAWVRDRSGADLVVDADALLRDPAGGERLRAAYDYGDGLHLSREGHRVLGEAVAAALR